MRPLRIGLIGDRDDAVTAHRAIPRALALAGAAAATALDVQWVGTETIDGPARLSAFDGLWCVPASPYRDMDGALRAIRHARETGLPFLGTCGGFQHAVVEYARNVLGWVDAAHAETAPDATRAVVVPLSCALVEVRADVHLVAGSRCAQAYDVTRIEEGYHCRYGLGSTFRAAIEGGPLRVAALDDAGDVRALELDGHPFLVATLFQHERAALDGRCPPLVRAFVDATAERARIERAA